MICATFLLRGGRPLVRYPVSSLSVPRLGRAASVAEFAVQLPDVHQNTLHQTLRGLLGGVNCLWTRVVMVIAVVSFVAPFEERRLVRRMDQIAEGGDIHPPLHVVPEDAGDCL